MYDLIYMENMADYESARADLQKAFPNAKFNDASDFIHRARFSINVDVPEDDYYLEIIDSGLAFCSLNFQILMKENTAKARGLVDMWQAMSNKDSCGGSGEGVKGE